MDLLKWISSSRKAKLVLTGVVGSVSAGMSGAVSPQEAMYSVVVLILGLILSIAWEDSARTRYAVDALEMLDAARELLTAAEEAAGKIDKEPAG
jgi:hypothetical protein